MENVTSATLNCWRCPSSSPRFCMYTLIEYSETDIICWARSLRVLMHYFPTISLAFFIGSNRFMLFRTTLFAWCLHWRIRRSGSLVETECLSVIAQSGSYWIETKKGTRKLHLYACCAAHQAICRYSMNYMLCTVAFGLCVLVQELLFGLTLSVPHSLQWECIVFRVIAIVALLSCWRDFAIFVKPQLRYDIMTFAMCRDWSLDLA